MLDSRKSLPLSDTALLGAFISQHTSAKITVEALSSFPSFTGSILVLTIQLKLLVTSINLLAPSSCWSRHMYQEHILLNGWHIAEKPTRNVSRWEDTCSQPVCACLICKSNNEAAQPLATYHCDSDKWIWLISAEIHKGLLLIKHAISR